MAGNFQFGDYRWFTGGKLNVSYNCIDRHLTTKGNQAAIIWESDEPGQGRTITYTELFHKVCQIANYMKSIGISKGDVVTIYMPMIPELPMVMLACTRSIFPEYVFTNVQNWCHSFSCFCWIFINLTSRSN
jgi:acetyl-CoA synthetase